MEQSVSFETVTKVEAAERQLRVAIRMFFERRDMIAVPHRRRRRARRIAGFGSAKGTHESFRRRNH